MLRTKKIVKKHNDDKVWVKNGIGMAIHRWFTKNCFSNKNEMNHETQQKNWLNYLNYKMYDNNTSWERSSNNDGKTRKMILYFVINSVFFWQKVKKKQDRSSICRKN